MSPFARFSVEGKGGPLRDFQKKNAIVFINTKKYLSNQQNIFLLQFSVNDYIKLNSDLTITLIKINYTQCRIIVTKNYSKILCQQINYFFID